MSSLSVEESKERTAGCFAGRCGEDVVREEIQA